MKTFIKCIGIFIIEQIREPIGFFWSFVAPIAYILLNARIHDGFYLPAEVFIQTCGWSLSYIALIGACNGFGLYLVGRRESGFVRSFLSNLSRRRVFIVAQYLASMIMTLAFGVVLITVTAYTLSDIKLNEIVALLMKFATTVMLFTFAATFFAALPLTFQSINSVITVVMTVIIVAGLATQSSTLSGNAWAANLNPFSVGAQFIAGDIPRPVKFPVLAMQCLVLGLLGVYGLLRLRINPEWSNR